MCHECNNMLGAKVDNNSVAGVDISYFQNIDMFIKKKSKLKDILSF